VTCWVCGKWFCDCEGRRFRIRLWVTVIGTNAVCGVIVGMVSPTPGMAFVSSFVASMFTAFKTFVEYD
jgi:hypothetical protein